jgi:signal transduction histidine kinase
MRHIHRRRRSAPRSAEYVAALGATLVVAGGLAFEAYDAARSHRQTAERALQEYAGFAARAYASTAEEGIRSEAAPLLAPLTGVRASSPFERLAPPNALAATAHAAFRCGDAERDRRRAYLRIDFRDGSLSTAGAPLTPRELRALAASITNHARASYAPDWSAAVLLDETAPRRDRAIIYGVKYAEHGAPIAAYGLTTCIDALRPALAAAAGASLLPVSATGGEPDDSLLAVNVHTGAGEMVYSSHPRYDSPFGAEVVLPMAARLRATVTLHPDAVNRVVIGPLPRSVIPEVLILLALTGALLLLATVQVRREQELARLRADFTSSVSHELRTPLAQIMLFAETLQLDRVRSERERREAVDVILQEARRLLHLVENVLQVSRTERGLTHLRRERRALAPLVGEAVTSFAGIADGADACVHARLDPSLVADVDPWAVRQMMLNLLDNAVKYGPRAQRITVSAEVRETRILLHVDDEGPGIPAAERENVFSPFVRLDAGSQGPPGSGIGLAVVRELAALHGGRAVATDAPGGGARLTIELPHASERPGSEPPRRWRLLTSTNGDRAHAAHSADRG